MPGSSWPAPTWPASDTESATSELRAARDAFGRLGAVLQTRITTDLLRQAARAQGAADVATRVSETFVFTDIVDSTRMIALIGDDAWVMLRRWHDTTLRSIFASHGGTEIDHAGDGFFVAFADASTAAACAVDIQRSLDAHRRLNGFAPLVRIGLHTAEVVVAGGDYQGAGVHVAARIGAAAAGGRDPRQRADGSRRRSFGRPDHDADAEGRAGTRGRHRDPLAGRLNPGRHRPRAGHAPPGPN